MMFLETIRCVDGSALHLSHHQKRLNDSLASLNIEKYYHLESLIIPPSEGIFRCRVLYDADTISIEYHPYSSRSVISLKLIHADTLEYPLKYANRHELDTLFAQRGECDDVLIVRHGLLTDTTIANIALYIDGAWRTPKNPLLMGTTRARLLEEGFLIPETLRPADIAKSERFALMNAMVGFIEVENGIIT